MGRLLYEQLLQALSNPFGQLSYRLPVVLGVGWEEVIASEGPTEHGSYPRTKCRHVIEVETDWHDPHRMSPSRSAQSHPRRACPQRLETPSIMGYALGE